MVDGAAVLELDRAPAAVGEVGAVHVHAATLVLGRVPLDSGVVHDKRARVVVERHGTALTVVINERIGHGRVAGNGHVLEVDVPARVVGADRSAAALVVAAAAGKQAALDGHVLAIGVRAPKRGVARIRLAQVAAVLDLRAARGRSVAALDRERRVLVQIENRAVARGVEHLVLLAAAVDHMAVELVLEVLALGNLQLGFTAFIGVHVPVATEGDDHAHTTGSAGRISSRIHGALDRCVVTDLVDDLALLARALVFDLGDVRNGGSVVGIGLGARGSGAQQGQHKGQQKGDEEAQPAPMR